MPPVLTRDAIFERVDTLDVVRYDKTRNHLSGAVSKLSPYLSRGVVSLPEVRDRLLARVPEASRSQFVKELAWREYFQRVWWHKGDAIFSDLRFPRNDWRHHKLVGAIVEPSTGIETLDAAVRRLYETGYLHNHERMWLASLATNVVGAHWLPMGKWLYYHLADGDLASNFLSWQWVAGTSVSKRYTFSDELMAGCGGVRARTWLPAGFEYSVPPIPAQMEETRSVATLTMEYPVAPDFGSVAGKRVALYTPWTLAPLPGDFDAQVLVIDPAVFDAFPVSPKVLSFILESAKLLMPELHVWVGGGHAIPGIGEALCVQFREHQTTADWVGEVLPAAWLFPEVDTYYPSFSAFWRQAERFL